MVNSCRTHTDAHTPPGSDASSFWSTPRKCVLLQPPSFPSRRARANWNPLASWPPGSVEVTETAEDFIGDRLRAEDLMRFVAFPSVSCTSDPSGYPPNTTQIGCLLKAS